MRLSPANPSGFVLLSSTLAAAPGIITADMTWPDPEATVSFEVALYDRSRPDFMGAIVTRSTPLTATSAAGCWNQVPGEAYIFRATLRRGGTQAVSVAMTEPRLP
jgi:hypothetical protein